MKSFLILTVFLWMTVSVLSTPTSSAITGKNNIPTGDKEVEADHGRLTRDTGESKNVIGTTNLELKNLENINHQHSSDNIRKKRQSFSYIAPDGTRRSETFSLYNDPRVRGPLNRISGTVSWVSPEGIPHTLNYVADGAGYRVVGNHIPK